MRPPAWEIQPVFPTPSGSAPPTSSVGVRPGVRLEHLSDRLPADGVPGLSHTLPNPHAVSSQTNTGPSRNYPCGSRSKRQYRRAKAAESLRVAEDADKGTAGDPPDTEL